MVHVDDDNNEDIYVGEFDVPRGDPFNDQLAAAANRNLELMVTSARDVVDQSIAEGGSTVEAIAAIAVSLRGLVDHGQVSLNHMTSVFAAALVRLAKPEDVVDLPPL